MKASLEHLPEHKREELHRLADHVPPASATKRVAVHRKTMRKKEELNRE